MNRPGYVLLLLVLLLLLLYCMQQCHAQPGFLFVADARDSAGVVVLTPAEGASRGAVWYNGRLRVDTGFAMAFRFRISERGGAADPGGDNGGDGFAVVLQNWSQYAIGGQGYGIGYGAAGDEPGIPNSIAVEFDTWDDTGLHGLAIDDYGSWHVALHSRGRAMNQPVQSATVGHTLLTGREDTLWHQVRIRYVPPRNGEPSLWSVWLDSTRVLAASFPLDSLLLDSGRAYVGFTAATMSAWERHEISNWVWNDSTAVPWYLRLTDTIVHIERYTDTVVHEVPLPPDTLYVDRWHSGDTVTVVRTDTLLVTRVDSVGYPLPPDTCYILRDTCCQNFDTVCGGSSRRMEPLLYRQGIDAIEPNPTGTTGTIRYTLGDRGAYTLAIYNSRGAQVWRAHGSAATEGRYQTTIDVTGWPPGFYIVRLYGPAGVQEGVMVVGR